MIPAPGRLRQRDLVTSLGYTVRPQNTLKSHSGHRKSLMYCLSALYMFKIFIMKNLK